MSNDLRELRTFRFQFFFHVASSSTELLIKKEELKDDLNSKVDLSLIIMAFYELKFMSTPYKVVINESVELAKKFGTKESPQFVNGILDRFHKKEIKK